MSGALKRAPKANADAPVATIPKVTPEVLAEDIAAVVAGVVQGEMALAAQVMGLGAAVMTPHPPQSEAEVEAGFDNMPV